MGIETRLSNLTHLLLFKKDSLENQKLPFELNNMPQGIKSFFLPVALGSVEYPGLILEIGHRSWEKEDRMI